MKFKLDENIGRHGLELLSAAGHDVMTVREQDLGGATDEKLFEVCAREGRALITLDHDFGQVPRFHLRGAPASLSWRLALGSAFRPFSTV